MLFIIVDVGYILAGANGRNGLPASDGENHAISYDGLHPNTKGYKVMQSLAKEAIARALKK